LAAGVIPCWRIMGYRPETPARFRRHPLQCLWCLDAGVPVMRRAQAPHRTPHPVLVLAPRCLLLRVARCVLRGVFCFGWQ
jgi:hypothetical protein